MPEITVSTKKPSKLPAILWTAIAGACAWRTFIRPNRAVVAKGYPLRCAGKDERSVCQPSLRIQGEGGGVTVYAVTSGRAAVTAGGISIASDREPVLVNYGPSPVQVFVANGQDVWLGQALGVMSTVELSVTELVREQSGSVGFKPVEPAAWLAARGLRIAASGNRVSELWCSHGRSITVPEGVLGCGIRLPDPSSALLLPVTVTTA